MTLFEIINNIYTKKQENVESDMNLNMTLSKWLTFDKKNLTYIKRILQYIFWIEPKHYYYLLWFNIPFTFKPPFLKKYERITEKPDVLYDRIKSIMDWTENELKIHKTLLDKVINRNLWKKELNINQ